MLSCGRFIWRGHAAEMIQRGGLSLRRMQLANLFEFHAEPVTKWAFGPQFFQKRLGLVERIWGNILAFEQVTEAALNLILGKQGDLLLRGVKLSHSRAAKWPGHPARRFPSFYWPLPYMQERCEHTWR